MVENKLTRFCGSRCVYTNVHRVPKLLYYHCLGKQDKIASCTPSNYILGTSWLQGCNT